MKIRLAIGIAWFLAAFPAISDPSPKEIVALMNRVQSRVAAGEISALDDLTTLPGKFAVPALLTIFKQHYNLNGASKTDKAIGVKVAQLVTTVSGGDEYIASLLKGKPANNYVYFQAESAIQCLAIVHNETSVRLLCGCLDVVDEDEIGPLVTSALTGLNLPAAPISPKDRLSNAAALSKWKLWWQAHKDEYTSKSGASSPTP